MGEHGAAKADAACFRPHEQIFKIDTGSAFKGRKIVKEQRETLAHTVYFADHYFGHRVNPEQIGLKHPFIEPHCMRESLVFGQITDQPCDKRDVSRGSAANGNGHDAGS